MWVRVPPAPLPVPSLGPGFFSERIGTREGYVMDDQPIVNEEPVGELPAARVETPEVTVSLPARREDDDTRELARPAWRALVAPAWFLLGVIVGLALFAGYSQLTAKPLATPAPSLDAAAVKSAAREGLIEAIATLQAQSAQAQQPQESTPAPVSRDAFKVRPANLLGDENAKVTLVEYADFQCPFCGRFYKTISAQLNDEYIKTGKVSFLYKHMAFLGPESAWAAEASECAADQGKFWTYHDLLFSRQNGENQGAFNKDNLVGFGKELGLDMTRFEKCVRNDETLDRVRADTQEGQQFGVNSTPTFFVNGQPVVGMTSYDSLKALLDKALQ